MSEPIRIGIAGARFAARFHWEGYQRVYGTPVQVVGVTSRSAESREEFARQHGMKAFCFVRGNVRGRGRRGSLHPGLDP